MEALIGRLLNASAQGIIAFVALLAVVYSFRNLHPSFKCWLWRICGLKLLASMAFVASLPILPATGGLGANHAIPTVTIADLSDVAATASTSYQPLSTTFVDWPLILNTCWLFGALVKAVSLIWRGASAGAQLLQSTRPFHIDDAIQSLGGRILLSDSVESPLVIGVLRPVILLPSWLPSQPEELRMAIIHEEAHIRRRDLLWQAVLACVGCCFWFLPPAQWIGKFARFESEMACDREVVESVGQPGRYYRFLVRLAQQGQPLPGIAGMAADTRRTLQRRIHAMKLTGSSRLLLCLSAAVLATPALIPWQAVAQSSVDTIQGPSIDNLAKRYLSIYELDYSPSQKQRFEELAFKQNQEVREFGNKLEAMKKANVSDKDRIAYDNKIRMPMFRRHMDERWSVLTEPQKERQRQVVLQYLGPMVIGNAEVSKLLGVPESNRIKIQSLAEDYRKFMRAQDDRFRLDVRSLLGIREVKIREFTSAEVKRMKQIGVQLYKASGNQRIKLTNEYQEVRMRGVRYQGGFQHGTSPGFREAQIRAAKRIMDERRKELARLSTLAESYLSSQQLAAWTRMQGERVEFPNLNVDGRLVFSYR